MQCYLIDPFNKTIVSMAYPVANGGAEELRNLYKMVNCNRIESVHIHHYRDAIYVDEEALLSNLEQQAFFSYEMPNGGFHFLVGKGLDIGCDDEGNATAPVIQLEELKNRIQWVEPSNGLTIAASIRDAGFQAFTPPKYH